jgi:hypothetical protein
MVERDDWTTGEKGIAERNQLVAQEGRCSREANPKDEYETNDAYQYEPNPRLTLGFSPLGRYRETFGSERTDNSHRRPG